MNQVKGIKTIMIEAAASYPIVSAYEFDHFKSDERTQLLMQDCTIYLIVQRPLQKVNSLRICDGKLHFEIIDATATAPLQCTLDLAVADAPRERAWELGIAFYKKKPDAVEPFNDIAAIDVQRLDGSRVHYITPQRFIFGFLQKRSSHMISGPIREYIDYKVHYIGKAFSQKVWDRLSAHSSLQKILTREEPMVETARPSFEISLILLQIVGAVENNIIVASRKAAGAYLSDQISPIVHEVDLDDESSVARFNSFPVKSDSPALTNEVEAMLIHRFKPEYNTVLFENYPEIANGTRSVGYSESTLLIHYFPATIFTSSSRQEVVLPQHVTSE